MALVKIQGVDGGEKTSLAPTDTFELQETANGDSYWCTHNTLLKAVTTAVTYTVAADGDPAGVQDFDSLEEAMVEVSKYYVMEQGGITLFLEDGQHIISDVHDDSALTIKFINTRLYIESASSDASLCTITFASGSTVTNTYFAAAYNALIGLSDITIDPRANGGSQVLFSLFASYLSSRVSYFDCIIKRVAYLSAIDGGTLLLNNTTVSDAISYALQGTRGAQIYTEGTCVIDNCGYGIYLANSSNFNLSSGTLTISNCATAGVWLQVNCTASFRTGSLTFSGNTLDSNNTINRVSVENELLTNGDGVIGIQDTPENGVVDAAISSNWAYDHENAADPHSVYPLSAEVLTRLGEFNNQTGVTYTITAADSGKVLTFNNAAACAVTLPDTLDTNFQCTIVQVGAGVPTVTRSGTDTINGAATGVTPSAQWKGMYLSQYAAGTWLALL